MIHRRFAPGCCVLGLAVAIVAGLLAVVPLVSAAEARWWKGNLHTHSLWSDGDDFPESIADWYKDHGYHFLALSDHNRMLEGEQWVTESQKHHFPEALEKNRRRFGADWLVRRDHHGTNQYRLKTLAEFRGLLEEPGRFLMIPSEEITSGHLSFPVHINATNLRKKISAQGGTNVLDVMQRGVNAVLDQRRQTGQPMFPHINHPNFGWGITAEDLMQVKGERFFEVYNGHPGVVNDGDALHLSMDAMWDVVLTFRLADRQLGLVWGIGTDDSHNYHRIGLGQSNSGRGWVMVRARHLTAESVVRAMEDGDFYASSGVTLADVRRAPGRLALEIQPEAGVTYVTRFIGTRRGFDRASVELVPPAPAKGGVRTVPHRRYSADVGAVLAEVSGPRAEYVFKGDELYVRAKIISSKPKANGSVAGEFETAWVQPIAGSTP
mgnify:CR=1 FL=1